MRCTFLAVLFCGKWYIVMSEASRPFIREAVNILVTSIVYPFKAQRGIALCADTSYIQLL